MTEPRQTPSSATEPLPPRSSEPLPPRAAEAPSAPASVRVLRLPSARASALLAAVMLAIGVAVGAAVGPAPNASFAGASDLPLLLHSLAGPAGKGSTPPPSTSASQPLQPASQAALAPAGAARRRSLAGIGAASSGTAASAVSTPTLSSSSSTPTAGEPLSSVPTTTGVKTHTIALPAVTNIWLIELSGQGFAAALAQPAAAPYTDGALIASGTLLSGWSAVAGSAFASETALVAGTPPQTIEQIVQPPCPEGPAGAQCAAGSAGALTATDEFLKQTVPVITATAAYRAHGLIVITFAAVADASAAGLPAGASTATLTTQPPGGVLLISPFVRAGARPSTSFNSASPERSLKALLR